MTPARADAIMPPTRRAEWRATGIAVLCCATPRGQWAFRRDIEAPRVIMLTGHGRVMLYHLRQPLRGRFSSQLIGADDFMQVRYIADSGRMRLRERSAD